MKQTRLLVLSLLFVALLGCGRESQVKAVLAGANKVEVFRLDGENGPDDRKPPAAGENRVGGFLVTAQGKDQDTKFAKKLGGLLSDKKNYEPNNAKCFNPGVAFRVWRDQERVDVLICFKCCNFYLGPPTDHAREQWSFESPLGKQLARLAKETFPDDKEIQQLED